ncbi:3-ketoacyl-ACP reductase [Paraburkholderia sp. Ac-20342]|uniref:3-ketoacyl-ACP reductase n=1 Tax=Paraburkholderia sp. Ac-20342 TaxID=2703889 RepID=UPI00197D3204|nr:3-ketoacyl-ACP reductase [Paraburkholderia sp. Ac-20342]MBN3849585.1 3-ketoacyl-ACP reductase [Paraburkholderia sp. Ac-20342]
MKRGSRGVALVTGAARGIGHAISSRLAVSGFDLALVSLEAEAPTLAHFIRDGVPAEYFSNDIADIDGHSELIDRVENALGPITCLVNNAGVTSMVRGDLLDVTPESFDRSVAVNLRGTFFLTQAVARRMLVTATPGCHQTIITISSANASIVGENRGDYCMTKSALAMMNKLFASRLASSGITTFEIRPGIIETEMTAPAAERYEPFIQTGGVPMRRWGQAEDVAQAVATLATGGLPFTTGVHIDVGGGMQLHRV